MTINVYENCPELQNDRFLMRLVEEKDCEGLLKVYSDQKARRFLDSDNCSGGFHFGTLEHMREVIRAWRAAYEQRSFVRWSIIDQETCEAVGTVELFHRDARDAFDNTGLLRIDLHSDYERFEPLRSILSLITEHAYHLFECAAIVTKAIPEAEQRICALKGMGFEQSSDALIGHDGTAYSFYWTRRSDRED